MKFLKRTIAIIIGLLLVIVIAFNARLYYEPSFVTVGTVQINKDLLNQLEHLKTELHNGAANDMQQIFPEGYLFLNALYALTWVEMAADIPEEEALSIEAHLEIDWTLMEMSRDLAKLPFDKDIEPEYGIFYRGWCNYVLAKKLAIQAPINRDPIQLAELRMNCDAIKTALDSSSSPFLQSYFQHSWPADMVVAMASIGVYEQLFPGTYDAVLSDWLSGVDSLKDAIGLIPHRTQWQSGATYQSSRGSSQSLILNFLIEIDPEYARKEFKIYKRYFLDKRLSLPGIREYPKGTEGFQDIDSGPVIWDIGGAASIVGQRTMARYGEETIAIGLRNSIEAFGIGYTSGESKQYLFGYLPIADAFIAWSNSVEAHQVKMMKSDEAWRGGIQALSLMVFSLGVFLIFILWRNKKTIQA